MPRGSVYIGRPSIFSNPYMRNQVVKGKVLLTNQDLVDAYRAWLARMPDLRDAMVRELKGRVLVCWCKPTEPCHGDVIEEIINERNQAHD